MTMATTITTTEDRPTQEGRPALDPANRALLALVSPLERSPFANLLVTAVRYGATDPVAVVAHARRELRSRLRQDDLPEDRRRIQTAWLQLLDEQPGPAADLARFYMAWERLDWRERADLKAAARLARLAQRWGA